MSALHEPLTGRPHPAGSEGTIQVVKYLQDTLSGFGLEVRTHEFQVLLDRPRKVEVTLTAPSRRALSVQEPAIEGDPTSAHPELGGGYISYSASGTATGQAVFVNYGLPADYAQLKTLGVSVKDRVAVARYGRSHRAVKVHTAQQQGARALVLYSDPADDGGAKGPAWPDGYWRGPDMLQRGNAKLSWFWHGDPLTPGVGATADAARLDPKAAPTLPKIPVVVLSAREATHVLAALGGPERPAAFASGIAGADARRPGTGRAQRRGRHGPGRAPDLRRRRLVEGHADAGADRALRHASRRLDLRRRRSRHRHDRDARTGQGPRPAGQQRLAAAAHHLAGVLGRRGVRTGRLDRVRRGVQGAAPGAAGHVREHRHVHEGALRSRRRAVAAGVRRRRRQGRPGRQQQRLRPVAAVRMDAPAAVAPRRVGDRVRARAQAARQRRRFRAVPGSPRRADDGDRVHRRQRLRLRHVSLQLRLARLRRARRRSGVHAGRADVARARHDRAADGPGRAAPVPLLRLRRQARRRDHRGRRVGAGRGDADRRGRAARARRRRCATPPWRSRRRSTSACGRRTAAGRRRR